MKKLQIIRAEQLKHPDYLYISNRFDYILFKPKDEALSMIDNRNWFEATDDQIVLNYIRFNKLDWKVQIFVPNYDRFSPLQGYTFFADQLRRGLSNFGVDFTPTLKDDIDLILVINSVWAGANTGQLKALKEIANQKKVPLAMFTMWESDHWMDTHFEELKEADFLIVPCKWNKETLRKQGYKKPIYICPLPNNESYSYLERPVKRKRFVFLHYNACDYRKGFPEYYEAYKEEFKPDEEVGFIQKTRANDPAIVNFNPYLHELNSLHNFKWIQENLSIPDILDLHYKTECFIFPSKGEGWGYPPMEALLTGNPVIIPNQHSFKDWFNSGCLEVGTELEPASFSIAGVKQENTGNWFKPKKEDIKKQMRFIFEEWKREGREAPIFKEAKKQSKILFEKYSQKNVARKFIDILVKRKIIEL